MRRTSAIACLILAVLCVPSRAQEPSTTAEGMLPPPTLKITSPLGRTGMPATVRIVAQVQWPLDEKGRSNPLPLRARFTVDGTEVGTVENGPPYAVNWIDDNPFEAREIVVEATLPDGVSVRDLVRLPAFEIADRTEVASILVDASVYDANGRPVSDLEQSAFAIHENGEPQALDLFSKEMLPTTLVMLVDTSQSMARRIDAVRSAAQHFARAMGPNDKMFIVPFNHIVRNVTGPTNDVATISEAIGATDAVGGTAILDAVKYGAKLLAGSQGRRAMILLTDGFDENSHITLAEALESVQAEQVTVYSVAIGGVTGVSLQGERTFRSITETSGGRAFFPWRDIDVPGVAKEIVKDQQARYMLSYTPSNQRKDGAWRSISIKLPTGYRAKTRDGYRAPLPPPVKPTIEFTAADRSNGFVSLAIEDLEVVEDGVRQRIETFQEAVEPVGIALLLDASGSMRRAEEAVRATAREFVGAVREEDNLALITFADEPLFGHLLMASRKVTYDAIDKYTTKGGTALYDGLWNALLHLKTAKGRRAIVLLSDGRDENNAGTAAGSTHKLNEVLELVRQVGAVIYPVGLGSRVDKGVLEQLATVSGGQAYYSDQASQLADPFRKVIENLRQRYVLSYTSTNSKHDGQWRRVQLRTRTPDVTVKAAPGYFAPGD